MWCSKMEDVQEYLPDPKEQERLPRQYLINVLATVKEAEFKNWVEARKALRNKKMAEATDSMVLLDPQVAAVVQSSHHVSCKYKRDP